MPFRRWMVLTTDTVLFLGDWDKAAAFCEKHNPHLLGIDVRRFVQFGLINQLLRQLSRFPLRDISAPYDPASDPDLKAVARYAPKLL